MRASMKAEKGLQCTQRKESGKMCGRERKIRFLWFRGSSIDGGTEQENLENSRMLKKIFCWEF